MNNVGIVTLTVRRSKTNPAGQTYPKNLKSKWM